MTPYYQDSHITQYNGYVLTVLPGLVRGVFGEEGGDEKA